MAHRFRPDPNNPEAYGVCAHSGRHFPRSQLIKQMEWRGNGLVWTGAWVHPDYADKPDEQNRERPLGPDPLPVKYPVPEPSVTGANGDNFLLLGLLSVSSELTSTDADLLDVNNTDHDVLIWK